ncbi:MAG: cytochrome c biogenesis CcdA family protein [Nanoarchaeota archaeon]|nr:cytochrome c biogenesis CcdA family protein [Nanoarchaeota archaeon]
MNIKRDSTNKVFFVLAVFTLMFLIPLASAETDSTISSATCTEECVGKVCVYYFYSPTCHACQSIKDFMNEFEQKNNETVMLHRFDVTKPENFDIYSNFCSVQSLSLEERGIPLVVTKEDFLMGTDDIKNKIDPAIQKLMSENKTGCISEDVCHSTNTTGQNATNTQQILTLPIILVAAIADSINPCAIGILIFMVGFLMLSSGKNKKRTLKIAILYIATVYIVYYLAGMGILQILSKLSFLRVINYIFGAGIAILGMINIKDAIENKPDGTLAIPTSAKPLIERWVYRASIPAAIILGIIVAAVELPCTGGAYLAILTLMANTVTRSTAMIYLAIYNFIFVLPLILITLLFIFGFEAQTLQGWLDKHKRKSRAIMGATLLAIGIILMIL